MPAPLISVLLTSFAGLGIPPTLSLPFSKDETIESLISSIISRLPDCHSRYIITTSSNKDVSADLSAQISTLLKSQDDPFIPLRITVPLYGGKGGFGSQLRAAGGRMSKRKKNQGENNGSSRNLDGRRLRTVAEAKALAEYLAVKPEMDKKDKEARRKRWEQVIQLAEKREDEVKSGKPGKVDGKWLEEKDEAAERTRDAVMTAISLEEYKLESSVHGGTSDSASTGHGKNGDEMPGDIGIWNQPGTANSSSGVQLLYGFDDDFGDESSDED